MHNPNLPQQRAINRKTLRSNFRIDTTIDDHGNVCLVIDFGEEQMTLPLKPEDAIKLAGIVRQAAIMATGQVLQLN